MKHALLLTVHIVAGVAGLALGPFVLRLALRRERSRRLEGAYVGAVAVVATTAVGLALLDWRGLWPFALLALGTGAAVAAGRWVADHPCRGWQARYMRLMGGSYVSLVTALVVVSWDSLVAWVLPIVVGSFLVERAAASVASLEPA
jgi:hypothetical protein